MVKPSSRPHYIDFGLNDEEAMLNDPDQEDGDETGSVESDNEMDDRKRQVRDIKNERYIDNRTGSDTKRSDHDESREDVEDPDLKVGMPRDHTYVK